MKFFWTLTTALIVFSLMPSCGSGDNGSGTSLSFPDGMIVYRLQSGTAYYAVNAKAGSIPVSLTKRLHDLSPLPSGGTDESVNVSPNGEWLVISTERFGNQGWAGLSVVKSDLSEGSAVEDSLGNLFHTGPATISSDGTLIVYQESDSGLQHLFAIRKKSGFWSLPVKITAGSPYRNHGRPSLSYDGTMVVFDCSMDSNEIYAQNGSDIGIVNTDGTGFAVKVTHDAITGGNPPNALRHPAFIPGGIVFEADWEGEQIWKLADGETQPEKITDDFHNDNSPCTLADGRIVSLWLGRPGNPEGYHEIKVMFSDGTGYEMIVTGKDILDDTIGSGGM